ncbi:GDSL-type esterase/lipase family protein [Lactiplantibacillus sp. WILCCON 0030]|uniref:GDSL-type esterase/lipase family protein n=1 Tax=Lactiplantibacillus brownii TaxID=3069269 RepID=A0ABU1A906_9LACO|nr:GDSL-type esterase/lipase family protein [Lactiplantibacillus brownii]MDQ7937351.1 GDSL-type esterase/lipase family protein [Lactiplantibacillus brownii]
MTGQIMAWQQMATYFPNITKLNRQHQQTIKVKQDLTAPRLRLLLVNNFSSIPLVITSLTVTVSGLTRRVKVRQQASFSVSAYEKLWTDWIDLPVQAGAWVTISLNSPTESPQTLMQTLDQSIVRLASLKQERWFGVAAIAVPATSQQRQLLIFGDSLTNQGYYSAALTTLFWQQQPQCWGVINGGISGNRLLRPGHSTSVWSPSFGAAGKQRLTELLRTTPVDELIVMAGLNDLLHPGTGSPLTELPTADQLIAGLKQVIKLAAQAKAKLWLLTITPFKNSILDDRPAWCPAKEAIRLQVNQWLREQSETIDVASLVADPADSGKLASNYDCGDHIHFSPVGGRLVAQAVFNHCYPQ